MEAESKTDCFFITSSKMGGVQFSIYPYLGVGYLSAFLKEKGMTSYLFDADVNNNRIDKLLCQIEKHQPLVIGYSVMSLSLPFFFNITKVIRKHFPKILIVAGGPHITNSPETVFEMGIDYGFIGSCEVSFSQFIKKIKNKISDLNDIDGLIGANIAGNIVPASFDVSFSTVPPDYDLYDLSKYQNISYGRSWFTVITSRGCAYNCKFCKDPGKNRYAEYPLESVKNQLNILIKQKGIRWITFVDDSFTFNRNRVIELCNWIIGEKLKFRWTCMTRVDILDSELISIMKATGLEYVIIGVEAGNENVRKGINKFIPNSTYINIINELKMNKIRVLCSYVLGNPNETYNQIKETVRFSLQLKTNYSQYYNLMPIPQSPVFRQGVKEGLLDKNVWAKYMKGDNGIPYYIPIGLNFNKLKRIKMSAFLRFYASPNKIIDLSVRLLKFYFDIKLRHWLEKLLPKNKFKHI